MDGEAVAVEEAERWLADADEEVVVAAFSLVVRAVVSYRVAAADPAIVVPALAHALVVRVGYGAGEDVAVGQWRAARELAVPVAAPRRRRSLLAPQERFAALLGGRSSALLSEELALRARADLARGQVRLAAVGVGVAFEVALVELVAVAGSEAFEQRIEELRGLAESVSELAAAAPRGPLPADAAETLTAALGRLEAALRARAAADRG